MTERAQRRGRAIAMTAAEVDQFLTTERTCRVATAGTRRAGRTWRRCGSSGTGNRCG